MGRKATFILIIFILVISLKPAFGEKLSAGYLCELGIAFYRVGRYDDALLEFEKALLIEPNNKTAKDYINTIFIKERPLLKEPTREEIINQTLVRLTSKKELPVEVEEKPPVTLSGEYRLSMGVTSEDVIWKDANADRVGVPREKNWRYLWGDKRHNTYDPKIYDRLTLGMQTQFENPLNAFMEITFDPWTFIGKNQVTVTSGTDVVDIDLKYWSADKRTINETYRSKQGQIINLKQIKVDDGETTLSGLTIAPTNATFNSIQPMDIDRDYRPIRKLWFDYEQDDYALKIFPISNQYEALTTDDPLRLSNNHVYWEESPWLDEYEPSRVFESGGNPIKKGRWIRRLSFFTRDSSDDYPYRLTFLRGASFKADTGSYSLDAIVASPMSLWDEYERSNSIDAAARLKFPLAYDLELGFTTTSKIGFNGGSREALNQLQGVDFKYQLSPWDSVYGEFAGSHTEIKEAKGFDTEYDGMAAKLGFNYDCSEGKYTGVYKGEFYLAHMDGKFYPGLSNYRYTRRDDPIFSRHIYFAPIKEEDKSLIWGDGIDRGRNVVGFKLNTKGFDERLDTDIKYRNVHKDSGKYIESVTRVESAFNLNPQLTLKSLAYYKHLPKTHAGYDPLIYAKTMYSLTDYFSEEDIYATNDDVIDDKDPSVGAFGLGAKYDITEQISVEGIYERTNDPLDFPRGLVNDVSVSTETRDGVVWDKVEPFLYDQNFFDLPPYDYYNIAKSRLIYTPAEDWEFILSYTFNENKHTSGIDDNINHAGLEATYTPTDKWTFWFKYIFSRLIDVYKQNKHQRSDFYEGHHNIFFGSEYKLNKDESFTFLYGEFVGYDDPYEQANWTLSALDTQHIFRIFYRRKF